MLRKRWPRALLSSRRQGAFDVASVDGKAMISKTNDIKKFVDIKNFFDGKKVLRWFDIGELY